MLDRPRGFVDSHAGVNVLGVQRDVGDANDPQVKVEGLDANAGFANVHTYHRAVLGVDAEQDPRASSFGLFASDFDDEPVFEQRRHKVGHRSATEAGHLAESHPIERTLEKEQP